MLHVRGCFPFLKIFEEPTPSQISLNRRRWQSGITEKVIRRGRVGEEKRDRTIHVHPALWRDRRARWRGNTLLSMSLGVVGQDYLASCFILGDHRWLYDGIGVENVVGLGFAGWTSCCVTVLKTRCSSFLRKLEMDEAAPSIG